MKLVSWNVNGLRAVVGKGFAEIFSDFDADCFCLQETKLKAGQIDLEFPGYESYWDYADKPGYAGTAIYTRYHPLSVRTGIGIDEHDHEGRAVTLEFGDFFLVNTYVPNSQNELKRLDYRMRWEDDFRAYLKQLEKTKPVILQGSVFDYGLARLPPVGLLAGAHELDFIPLIMKHSRAEVLEI